MCNEAARRIELHLLRRLERDQDSAPVSRGASPYHDRQIVLFGPADYARWLDPSVPARELCKPLPAGALEVRQVR